MEIAHGDVAQRYDLDRPPPASGWQVLTRPGWVRAAWMTALFFGLGFGLVVLFRWWGGWQPIVDWQAITVVGALTAAPHRLPRRARRVRLLAATGRSASRRGPRTTPVTARARWKDYFRINTDHKVIGIQYVVDDDLLLPDRRPARDAHARRARQAGNAVRGQPDLQRSVLGPRLADDLPVRDPGLCRARELRHPADDRRAGHGVPAPERPLVLVAADRRIHDAGDRSSSRAGRSPPGGRTTPRSRSTSR